MKSITWIALITSLAALALAGYLLFAGTPTTTSEPDNATSTTNDLVNVTGDTSLANSPDAGVNDTPTLDAASYTNPQYSYTAELPTGWTASEETVFDSTICPDEQNVSVFSDADLSLTVTVGLRATGDNVSISCRTGVGAGTVSNAGTIQVAGESVPVVYLKDAFGGTPYEVFVGNAAVDDGNLPTNVFEIGNYELVVTISQTTEVVDPNSFEPSYVDITGLTAYQEALDLLASIQLP